MDARRLPPPLDRVRTVLEERRDVVLAYLFGSAAAGTLSPESDVDVGVLTRHEFSAQERASLIRDLAQATGRPVDLVDLHQAGSPLLQRILGTGREIVCRDRAAKERLILRMLGEAEDFLPLRRRALQRRRDRWIGTS
jgi:predicted nucleotidyltransferase